MESCGALARFLMAEEAGSRPPLELLAEVRNYVAFLRSSHGLERPADESDEWSGEDERDLQLAARKRLDDEDPYAWPEDPGNAPAE